jgi:hypothetical protein
MTQPTTHSRIGRRELFRIAESRDHVVVCDECDRALSRDGRCQTCDQGRPANEQAELVDESVGWQQVELGPVLNGEQVEQAPSVLLRTGGLGLLYRGKVHIVAGEPEAAKGWLALCCCAERMALGEHVVYLDFEDVASTAVARLRLLGLSDEVIFGLFHYFSPEDPLVGDIREVVPSGVTLAVFDGVTEALTLHGLALVDNTDVAKFLTTMARPLARDGTAVLLLDHVGRDRETRGRGAIGAQHKLAGVDVAYSMDIVTPFGRGLEGLSRLTVTKDRPGFIRAASTHRKVAAEVELLSGQDEVEVVVRPMVPTEADPLSLTRAGRRVLEALPFAPPGSSPQEIGDRVVEQGWTPGLHRITIQKHLRNLAERGLAAGTDGRWWRTSR